jgi:hypothetical protein
MEVGKKKGLACLLPVVQSFIFLHHVNSGAAAGGSTANAAISAIERKLMDMQRQQLFGSVGRPKSTSF